MMRNWRFGITAVLAVFVFSGFGVSTVFADEGSEMLFAHPVKLYPGAVPDSVNDGASFLTKDSIAKVKAFYEKNIQPGDKITVVETDGEKGFRMTYSKVIDKKTQTVLELEWFENKPTGRVHDALGELMLKTKLGQHSEAEFKAMEKRYGNLTSAYYRMIDNGKGGTVSEGKAIYKEVFDRVHGDMKARKAAGGSSKDEDKERAKEMKMKMKEMKAKGDFEGMMRLAQESKMGPNATPDGAAAMDDMTKDTWNDWVDCLKALDAAAYWTRISYSSNALPEGR
jgi:hypothetical protein